MAPFCSPGTAYKLLSYLALLYMSGKHKSKENIQNVSQLNGSNVFPCPVCLDPREVKLTKKKKPYITCDPCGIQLFVRVLPELLVLAD